MPPSRATRSATPTWSAGCSVTVTAASVSSRCCKSRRCSSGVGLRPTSTSLPHCVMHCSTAASWSAARSRAFSKPPAVPVTSRPRSSTSPTRCSPATSLVPVEEDRFPLAAVYAVLLLLGAALGVWGAFLVPLRLPGGIEGFADVLAIVGNVAVGFFAARGARSVPASAMSGIGWLVSVFTIGLQGRPADEIVIPSKLGADPGVGTVGTLYLLLGAVGAIAAVLLANRDRTRWRDVPDEKPA